MDIKRISCLGLSLPLAFGLAFAGSGQRLTSSALTSPASLDQLIAPATRESAGANPTDQSNVKHNFLKITYSLAKSKYSYDGKAGLISGKVSGTTDNPIADFIYAHRLSRDMVVGLSYSSPYNFDVKYSAADVKQHFPGVVQFPTRRKLDVKDISPTVSYRVNDKWVVGGAIDYTDGTLLLGNYYTPPLENALIDLQANGLGYHLGVKYHDESSDIFYGTVFEAAYFSKVKYDLEGDVTALGTITPGVKSTLTQPYAVKFDIIQVLPSRKDVLVAMINYTHWSSVPEFKVTGLPAPLPSSTAEKLGYKNEWTYTAAYQRVLTGDVFSPKWTATAGLVYDKSPADQALKSPTSTEPKDYWLGLLSTQYHFGAWAITAGVYHAFLKDSTINNTTSDYSGTVKADANGGSLGVSYTF
mgnify:CR=1 FL=1